MYIQAVILMADLVWSIFDAPVLLFPLKAALCVGFLCGSESGRYTGMVSIKYRSSVI